MPFSGPIGPGAGLFRGEETWLCRFSEKSVDIRIMGCYNSPNGASPEEELHPRDVKDCRPENGDILTLRAGVEPLHVIASTLELGGGVC